MTLHCYIDLSFVLFYALFCIVLNALYEIFKAFVELQRGIYFGIIILICTFFCFVFVFAGNVLILVRNLWPCPQFLSI